MERAVFPLFASLFQDLGVFRPLRVAKSLLIWYKNAVLKAVSAGTVGKKTRGAVGIGRRPRGRPPRAAVHEALMEKSARAV